MEVNRASGSYTPLHMLIEIFFFFWGGGGGGGAFKIIIQDFKAISKIYKLKITKKKIIYVGQLFFLDCTQFVRSVIVT